MHSYVLLLCLAVIYCHFALFFGLVHGGRALKPQTAVTKGPWTPGVKGQPRANRPKHQEGRLRDAFWTGGPSVMETCHVKVLI